MSRTVVDFDIGIPSSAVSHMKDISHYDYNFYHIGDYGDWLFGDLDTILQIYHECENVFEYQYGYFEGYVENDSFKPVLCWHTQKDIFYEKALKE